MEITRKRLGILNLKFNYVLNWDAWFILLLKRTKLVQYKHSLLTTFKLSGTRNVQIVRFCILTGIIRIMLLENCTKTHHIFSSIRFFF